MSTKNSIFFDPKTDEHIYEDCANPIEDENGNFIGDEIFVELNLGHVEVAVHDKESLVISLKDPNSAIYKAVLALRDAKPKPKPNRYFWVSYRYRLGGKAFQGSMPFYTEGEFFNREGFIEYVKDVTEGDVQGIIITNFIEFTSKEDYDAFCS